MRKGTRYTPDDDTITQRNYLSRR